MNNGVSARLEFSGGLTINVGRGVTDAARGQRRSAAQRKDDREGESEHDGGEEHEDGQRQPTPRIGCHAWQPEHPAAHQHDEHRGGREPEERDAVQPVPVQRKSRCQRQRHGGQREAGAPLLGVRIQAEQDDARMAVDHRPARTGRRGAGPRHVGLHDAIGDRPTEKRGQRVDGKRGKERHQRDVESRREDAAAQPAGQPNPRRQARGGRRGHRAPRCRG